MPDKTELLHPKRQGDDLPLPGEGDAEVIEVFPSRGTETVDLRADKGKKDDKDDDRPAARDSKDEGDARTLATEDDDGDTRTRRANGDDDGDYSRKVRARINRERALRIRRENELSEERTARQALEDRLGRIERAQADLTSNTGVQALEAQIASIIEKLAAATEAGETKTQMALQIELGDKQADLKLLKYDLDQKRQAASRATQERKRPAEADADSEKSPRVDDWITENGHWWNRKKFAAERAATIAIDAGIMADIESGQAEFERYSDEHFEELAARVSEKFPHLEINSPDGEPYAAEEPEVNNRERKDKPKPRAPVGAGAARSGRREVSAVEMAKQGKVNLGDEQFENMRRFGLDPSNPDHKKRFAKEVARDLIVGDRT